MDATDDAGKGRARPPACPAQPNTVSLVPAENHLHPFPPAGKYFIRPYYGCGSRISLTQEVATALFADKVLKAAKARKGPGTDAAVDAFLWVPVASGSGNGEAGAAGGSAAPAAAAGTCGAGTVPGGGAGAEGQRWGRWINVSRKDEDGMYLQKLSTGLGLQGLGRFLSFTGIGSSTDTYKVALWRPEPSGTVGRAVVLALAPAGPHCAAPPAAGPGATGVAPGIAILQQHSPLPQPPSDVGAAPLAARSAAHTANAAGGEICVPAAAVKDLLPSMYDSMTRRAKGSQGYVSITESVQVCAADSQSRPLLGASPTEGFLVHASKQGWKVRQVATVLQALGNPARVVLHGGGPNGEERVLHVTALQEQQQPVQEDGEQGQQRQMQDPLQAGEQQGAAQTGSVQPQRGHEVQGQERERGPLQADQTHGAGPSGSAQQHVEEERRGPLAVTAAGASAAAAAAAASQRLACSTPR